MKKLFLTTLLLTLGLLTGCGNKMEANEVETEMETTTVYDEAIESSEELVEDIYEYYYWSEEYFEEVKYNAIGDVVSELKAEGACDECINETIELVESLEYDSNYPMGFDYETLMKDYLRILMKYEVLPDECYEYTIDELYEMIE